MTDLTAIVLTYNERENLPPCLASLKPLGCPVFVVDSGSTDGTQDIAAGHGATVVAHPFSTHAAQWQWALANLPLTADWVLALDADQRVTPELAEELRRRFGRGGESNNGINGFYVNRRQIFRGRWIRHGAYYPKYLLKLFRRDAVELDVNDLVDHHFYVRGTTGKLRHDIIEENKKEDDITFWIAKHNRYAALMAQEELSASGRPPAVTPALFGSPDQRVLRLKALWRSLPLFLRPCLYFGYRYFLRGGWLDGKEGFIFHFLQGFWFRLLVDIKMEELRTRRGVAAEVPSPAGDGAPQELIEHESSHYRFGS